MDKDTTEYFWAICIVVCLILGVAHLWMWFLSKVAIWATYTLFEVNFYGKFWAIYALIFLISSVLGGVTIKNKKEG